MPPTPWDNFRAILANSPTLSLKAREETHSVRFASWLCNYSHSSLADMLAQARDQLKHGGQLPGSTDAPFRAFPKSQCNSLLSFHF